MGRAWAMQARAVTAALLLFSPAVCLAAGDISNEGVLGVRPGMSLAEARAAIPGSIWRYEPRFMVDFSADCLMRGEETVFCTLVYEDPAYNPEAVVEGMVVLSATLKTSDGVHVGMSIVDAERLWGDASFDYNFSDEGREYVFFADGPERIAARAVSPSLGEESFGAHVGLYEPLKEDQEYQRTTVFRSDAVIHSLWVN